MADRSNVGARSVVHRQRSARRAPRAFGGSNAIETTHRHYIYRFVGAIEFRRKTGRSGTAAPRTVQVPTAAHMQKLLKRSFATARWSLRCNAFDGHGHQHSSQDQTFLIAYNYRIDAINGLSLWERSR
jgi:hypothetical protein